MDAYDRSRAIEQATMTRVAEIYAGALRKALENKKAFLQKVKDVEAGKIKPPAYYKTEAQIALWKEGFLRELIRQNAVIDGIMRELNNAGVDAAQLIRKSMVDIYQVNRDEVVATFDAADQRIRPSFSVFDRRQIDVLVEEGQSPFSKLAYENMGQNPAIRRKLQNELGMASILGEGQQKIIERIRKVTGQTVAQARRVAQTERTRVQSQARWQAGQEAKEMGIRVVNEWSTRMVNSRESHIALNGTVKPQGEPFRTVWGNELMYPGDPSAPAREVINCHCVLVPDVLLPEESKTPTTNNQQGMASQSEIDRRKALWRQRQTNNPATNDGAVKTPILDTKGANSDFVREATRALQKLERKMGGGTIPGLTVKFGGVPSGARAAYQDRTKTLFLPKKGSLIDFEKRIKATNARYMAKWKKDKPYESTETFIGIVYHELAHALDDYSGNRLSGLLDRNKSISEKSVRISAYAGSHEDPRAPRRSEAWAENFAAYMEGGKYANRVPQEIIDIIEDFFEKERRRR